MNRRTLFVTFLLLASVLPALAQQPATLYVPSAGDKARLAAAKEALSAWLQRLPVGTPHAPDAAVFVHIAEMAERLELYTSRGQVQAVLRGLETGVQRCDLLARGETPWITQPGRTVRGYVSRIDGSVQPYGVVLPARFDARVPQSQRLDVVLHGRGPTEVTFLQQQEPAPNSEAARAPEQLFIEVHPFGRGNNGWRWAGETDVFEVLEQVRKQYRIDSDRVILRGFSMGGHGAWHIGLHYPDQWAAVSPGAGFSETRKYLKLGDGIPPYQEDAWHIYDAVGYALNLFNTPFVAYGGEKDPQLQAALNMREAAEREGLPLDIIVGPNTEHRYHPDSLREIMSRLATPRRQPRKEIRFATWTLKYNRCDWVRIDGLQEHYQRATVRAAVRDGVLGVTTENVTRLSLLPVPGDAGRIEVDGREIKVAGGQDVTLVRDGGRWRKGEEGDGLRKRHNLQGPIDDALMEPFLAIRGTGTAWEPSTQSYAEDTLRRFQSEWRLGFRGEVPVKDDRDVTPADWADRNLILFGDPGSNSILARIVERLPLKWTRAGVKVGDRTYERGSVPVLIYPNPLNPERYVVINSGHTWAVREIEASNANLTPKLPDWAVLKPGNASPEVLDAGYFDERWRLRGKPGSP